MIISLISIVINLGTSIPLSMIMGLPGVAIGTCIGTVVSVILQSFVLRKKLSSFGKIYTLSFVWKCFCAGLAATAAIWFITKTISSSLLSFILATIIGFSVFLVILLLVKEEYTLSIVNAAKAKLLGRVKR